jgi:hypothetical protein
LAFSRWEMPGLFLSAKGAGHWLTILVALFIGMKIMIEVEIARLQGCLVI